MGVGLQKWNAAWGLGWHWRKSAHRFHWQVLDHKKWHSHFYSGIRTCFTWPIITSCMWTPVSADISADLRVMCINAQVGLALSEFNKLYSTEESNRCQIGNTLQLYIFGYTVLSLLIPAVYWLLAHPQAFAPRHNTWRCLFNVQNVFSNDNSTYWGCWTRLLVCWCVT